MNEPTVSSDHDASKGPPLPGWVKALLLIAVVIVVVLVVSKLFGVEHGPGRHGSMQDGPGQGAGSSAALALTGPEA